MEGIPNLSLKRKGTGKFSSGKPSENLASKKTKFFKTKNDNRFVSCP